MSAEAPKNITQVAPWPTELADNDPYMIREVGTELDQRTSFRGEVHP